MSHEIKYSAPHHQARSILAVTSAVLAADNDFPSNWITSLYFDTSDWQCAHEKASSDYNKIKVRVRYYGELTPQSSCFIETKRKCGARRNKVRTEVPASTLKNHDELLLAVNEFVAKEAGASAAPLVPSFYIRYHRHRFQDHSNRSRVALDNNIHAIRYESNNGNSTLAPSYYLDDCVLEIKGPHRDMPARLDVLKRLGLRKNAFSKYYYGFCKITDYDQ